MVPNDLQFLFCVSEGFRFLSQRLERCTTSMIKTKKIKKRAFCFLRVLAWI